MRVLAGMVTCFLMAATASAATFTTTTRGGKTFTMDVDGERVTGETTEFALCGASVDSVKRVKLWMPEHGHGSTPVQLSGTEDGCRIAKKVNFSMSGSWEVRVELSDGDSGAFLVDVE